MNKCFLQGVISKAPVQTGDNVFGRFVFTIIPNGKTEEIEVVAWTYRGFGKRYKSGDKVVVIGEKRTRKIPTDNGVKCVPIVVVDSITANKEEHNV